MKNSLVRAYLDDYQDIEVIIDKAFCQGRSDVFYLTDGVTVYPLELVTSREEHRAFVYKVRFDGEINVGTEYQIMVTNNFKCILNYRFIVKTYRFDEEFYYDPEEFAQPEGDAYGYDDASAYDAMGRKVQTTMKGHLYIRNGKKFIAK